MTSAADLKFLHPCREFQLRNFKSKSGTKIIELLVPFGFRSSCPRMPHRITNFENRALAICHGTKRSHGHVAGWNQAFDERPPDTTRIAKEHIA